MPNFVLTYDLTNTNPSPYASFLEQAINNGWQLWVRADGGALFRLPNTTLIGTFQDMNAAEGAMNATRAAASRAIGIQVTIEKWIISERTQSRFSSNVTRP